MESSNANVDMAQFFDFGEASGSDTPHELGEMAADASVSPLGNEATDGCVPFISYPITAPWTCVLA
jgi:hypothetical protein